MSPSTFRHLLGEAAELQYNAESYLRRLAALKEVRELSGSKHEDEHPDEDDLQTLDGMLLDLKELVNDVL